MRDIVYHVTMPVAWAGELADAPWEAIAARPWIVAPEPRTHRRFVMELFHAPAPSPERIVEADNESVINNLVESGVGLSLIRDEIATQSVDAGRSVIWQGPHVTTQLWLVHLADRAIDPLLVALTDALRRGLARSRVDRRIRIADAPHARGAELRRRPAPRSWRPRIRSASSRDCVGAPPSQEPPARRRRLPRSRR